MAVPGIPLDVADATPEWLSAALGRAVVGVDVVDAHSGTTGRARLALSYDDGVHGPAAVFLKLAPFDEQQRRFVDTVGLGVAEARFYRDVAGEVPVRVPAVHHAALDDSGRFVMVLEDLEDSGCRFPSPRDPDVVDTIAAVVEGLGVLHARVLGLGASRGRW